MGKEAVWWMGDIFAFRKTNSKIILDVLASYQLSLVTVTTTPK